MTEHRVRGRRPLPLTNPRGSEQRFAWLARVIRSYHPEPGMRHSATFAARLNAQLTDSLQPASINRLENGQLRFDVNRVRAYEAALDIAPDRLVDVYIYLLRLEDREPRWQIVADALSLDSHDFDTLYRVARGERLSSGEWLDICHKIVMCGPVLLESAKYRDAVCHGVLEAFGPSFERDERLLRESLILLGEVAVPYIVSYAVQQPITHFNAVEALGFIPSQVAWDALVHVAARTHDPVQVSTLLEPIRRWLRREPSRLYDLLGVAVDLIPYCAELLARPTDPFTSREEALAFLRVPGVSLPPRVSRQLAEYREDLGQLRVRPVTATPTEIADAVCRAAQQSYADSPARVETMPVGVPGLEKIIRAAVFSGERVERLGLGIALAPLPIAREVSHALGQTLVGHIDSADYGVQRSLLRLLTKIGDTHSHQYFSGFARQRPTDEGARLAVAWALGTGSGQHDESCLRLLLPGSTAVTRRVVGLAARRRGYEGLLHLLSKDRDPQTSSEAREALARPW